jgi:uncharacterized protein (TIGR02145 family)
MKTREIIVLALAGILLVFSLIYLIFMNQSSEREESNVPTTSTSVRNDNIVTDADGNTYDVVKIGEQVWMKSNLRTTHYADGTEIERTTTCKEKEPRYYKDEETGEIYYNGYIANLKICPDGWHVSSYDDWTKLEDYLVRTGRYSCGKIETSIAKSLASTEGWDNYNDSECAIGYNPRTTNNSTGFSALPMGYVYYNEYTFNEYENPKVYWDDWGAFFLVSGNKKPYGEEKYVYGVILWVSNEALEPEGFERTRCLSVRCVRDDQ